MSTIPRDTMIASLRRIAHNDSPFAKAVRVAADQLAAGEPAAKVADDLETALVLAGEDAGIARGAQNYVSCAGPPPQGLPTAATEAGVRLLDMHSCVAR